METLVSTPHKYTTLDAFLHQCTPLPCTLFSIQCDSDWMWDQWHTLVTDSLTICNKPELLDTLDSVKRCDDVHGVRPICSPERFQNLVDIVHGRYHLRTYVDTLLLREEEDAPIVRHVTIHKDALVENFPEYGMEAESLVELFDMFVLKMSEQEKQTVGK